MLAVCAFLLATPSLSMCWPDYFGPISFGFWFWTRMSVGVQELETIDNIIYCAKGCKSDLEVDLRKANAFIKNETSRKLELVHSRFYISLCEYIFSHSFFSLNLAPFLLLSHLISCFQHISCCFSSYYNLCDIPLFLMFSHFTGLMIINWIVMSWFHKIDFLHPKEKLCKLLCTGKCNEWNRVRSLEVISPCFCCGTLFLSSFHTEIDQKQNKNTPRDAENLITINSVRQNETTLTNDKYVLILHNIKPISCRLNTVNVFSKEFKCPILIGS